MKSLVLNTALYLIIIFPSFAQSPNITWEKLFGDDGGEAGSYAQQTTDGGFIVFGSTNSIGSGGYDIWLLKTDENGNEEWSRTFGGSENDFASEGQQTADGGYIIIGSTKSYGGGDEDVWLIKTGENGNEEWSKTFGGLYRDWGTSIQETSDGGYILIGGTEPGPASYYMLLIIKVDQFGIEEWSKTLGGSNGASGYGVKQTINGEYIILGTYYDGTSQNIWLLKIGLDGQEIWSKTIGDHYLPSSLDLTTDEGFIICGTFSIPNEIQDVFLLKTDGYGNEEWIKTFGEMGASNADYGVSVQQTSDGGYIIGSITWSYGAGYDDKWIIKTDENGTEVWSKVFGGNLRDHISSVQETSDGGYIATGDANWFFPDPLVNSDLWLLRLDGSTKIVKFYNNYLNNPNFLVGTNTEGGPDIPVKICADGSNVTTITFQGNFNMDDIEFIIQEDPNGSNIKEYGKLDFLSQTQTSKEYRYTHPVVVNENNVYKEIHLNVIDNGNNGVVVYNYPMHIYRAPVLMVHGLWSNPDDAFGEMKNELQSNYWPEELTFAWDYEHLNDLSFYQNRYVVDIAIWSNLKFEIIGKEKYSAGRVNIVAHSMGGILSRIYLQSDEYRGDINKLITLNTPHSGSQMANFLLDPNITSDILETFLYIIGKNTQNGAVDDLKVDSDAILNYLNGIALNNKVVPSHSILSTALVSEAVPWESILHPLINIFIPDIVVDAIFNFRPNDNVVPDLSQEGGILHSTEFIHQSHNGSSTSADVINSVIDLLNKDPNDINYFSQTGFHPPELEYTFTSSSTTFDYLNSTSSKQIDGSVVITNPPTGSHHQVGTQIMVTVTGSSDINKILFAAGNSSIAPFVEIQNAQQGSFNYTIPMDAGGRINFLALGSNDSGYVDLDTIYIYADVSADLDSIESNPKDVYLLVGNTNSISVKGYYSDGFKRDLSYNPDVNYSVLNQNVAIFSNPGTVEGLSVDTTTAVISYQDKYATTKISVQPDSILTDVEIDLESENNEIIESFYLYQNYPNPFNPITKVKYSVVEPSFVSLKIYDVLGREVITLVNEEKPTGNYIVEFNGSNLASGIYFYRIQTGNFVETKKMILLK